MPCFCVVLEMFAHPICALAWSGGPKEDRGLHCELKVVFWVGSAPPEGHSEQPHGHKQWPAGRNWIALSILQSLEGALLECRMGSTLTWLSSGQLFLGCVSSFYRQVQLFSFSKGNTEQWSRFSGQFPHLHCCHVYIAHATKFATKHALSNEKHLPLPPWQVLHVWHQVFVGLKHCIGLRGRCATKAYACKCTVGCGPYRCLYRLQIAWQKHHTRQPLLGCMFWRKSWRNGRKIWAFFSIFHITYGLFSASLVSLPLSCLFVLSCLFFFPPLPHQRTPTPAVADFTPS